MIVRHMGEFIPLDKLVRHYRTMAHREPRSAAFWRQRVRVVIAEARATLAMGLAA